MYKKTTNSQLTIKEKLIKKENKKIPFLFYFNNKI